MPKKEDADDRDHQALFQKFFPQRIDRAIDQGAPIVGWHDTDTWRQRGLDLLNLLLDVVDYLECVLALAHHDDSSDNFTLSVKLGNAIPKVRSQMHFADIFDVDRNAVLDLQDYVLQITEAFDVTT